MSIHELLQVRAVSALSPESHPAMILRSMIAIAMLSFLAVVSGLARAETGIASVYTVAGQGTRTASGIPFRDDRLTAAHKTLRFGTRVRVTNLHNGKSVVVTITDRGPFIRGRIVDLSMAGARAIGMGYGLAKVRLEVMR